MVVILMCDVLSYAKKSGQTKIERGGKGYINNDLEFPIILINLENHMLRLAYIPNPA